MGRCIFVFYHAPAFSHDVDIAILPPPVCLSHAGIVSKRLNKS